MAEAKISFEPLGDFNWASWKFRMELLLLKEDLWETVTKPKPENADAVWLLKDAKARATIGLALANNQLCHVLNAATAKNMWDALKGYHERSSLTNKIHALRKLYSLRLAEDGSMSEHLAEIAGLVNRLSGMGENLAEHLLIALMLSSLPESYSALITALESRGEAELKLDYVKGQLLDEWRRRNEASASVALPEKVLKITAKPRKNIPKVCHYCKLEGHFRRDCRKFLADQQAKKQQQQKQTRANTVMEEESEFCFVADAVRSDVLWYLDSGASAHMTNNRDFLSNLEESQIGNVFLADGKKLPTGGSGIGKIVALNEKGEEKNVTLKKVLHVPDLTGNLISVGRIADEGFEVVFSQNICRIMKNGESVLIGERKGGLYSLKQPTYQSLLSEVPFSVHCQHLWHRRLGHRHPEAVKRIVKEDLGINLKLRDCGAKLTCTVCCEGKLARKPFPKFSETKSSELLEVVHTDLCGPMEMATPGGNRFVMTMIDDLSKYTVIYLLKHKSEAYDKIREYVSYVQNTLGRKPKVLRCDGGGEYSSKILLNYLRENGITLQQTAPYSPQQNGTAERKNRSLMEMMRCLLSDSGLDKKYWGEAVMTANYLLNRLPSASIDRTPYEYWIGSKPHYDHLRVFGSLAFVHVPDVKRKKLDKKAVRLVFVGYEPNRKAWRFLDTQTNRIVVSRDAEFFEMKSKEAESVPSTALLKNPGVEVDLSYESRGDDHHCLEEEIVGDVSVPDGDETLTSEMNESDYTSATEMIGVSSAESLFEGYSSNEFVRRSKRLEKGKLLQPVGESAKISRAENGEPRNLKEADTSLDSKEWRKAMEAELKSHADNHTWDLVELPAGRKLVGSRWVYKLKRDATGEVIRYKARLVAQGYSQQYGVDFDEVYAPVTNQTTFRALLALASKEKIKLKHLDVKTAYLHGELDEKVFMRQPPGFVKVGQENLVCLLRKSIYGLKQSARCWNAKLHMALTEMNFKQSKSDACLYTKLVGGHLVYVLVYVDDILVGCKDEKETTQVYNTLKQSFDITNLGDLSFFLGMEIGRKDSEYSIALTGYIDKVVKRFGMTEAKTTKTPMDTGFLKLEDRGKPLQDITMYRSLLGALLYISVHARPDISASVSILGRRVSYPYEADWTAAKRIVRYLKGTRHYKLMFNGVSQDLIGYSDADWAGDQESRKSTTGFCFLLNGAAVSWVSRRQPSVTLSSMEAEYTALSEACQEAVWIRNLLRDLGAEQKKSTIIHEDNQSCLAFVRAERLSRRSKHIETKEHFVKELCSRKEIELIYCPTEDMAADILTKPLGNLKQRKFVGMLGLNSSGTH